MTPTELSEQTLEKVGCQHAGVVAVASRLSPLEVFTRAPRIGKTAIKPTLWGGVVWFRFFLPANVSSRSPKL